MQPQAPQTDEPDAPVELLPVSAQVREGTCLLLAIGNRHMLVPRNLVAEVIRHSLSQFTADPRHGLRSLAWRGRRVPYLDATVLGAAGDAPNNEETQVAVFHGLKNPALLPYYCLTISRGPRLLRIGDGALVEDEGKALHPAALMHVRLEGQAAFIPSVDHIENSLINLLQQTDE